MGQSHVLEWLKNQRLKGVDYYFTPKEIYKGLRYESIIYTKFDQLNDDIYKLLTFDFLEARSVHFKNKNKKGIFQHRVELAYRIRKTYCKK